METNLQIILLMVLNDKHIMMLLLSFKIIWTQKRYISPYDLRLKHLVNLNTTWNENLLTLNKCFQFTELKVKSIFPFHLKKELSLLCYSLVAFAPNWL